MHSRELEDFLVAYIDHGDIVRLMVIENLHDLCNNPPGAPLQPITALRETDTHHLVHFFHFRFAFLPFF